MSASRKRHPVWRTLLVMGSDALAIGVGLLGAYWIRFYALTAWTPVNKGWETAWYLKILPLAWVVWLLALRFENLYRRRSRVFDFNVVRRIITGSGLALLILLAINFYYRPDAEYSRLVTLIMLAVGILALIANRVVLHFLFRWMLVQKGFGQSRTAIVGTGPLVARIYNTLRNNPEQGMLPVGVILGGGEHQRDGIPPDLPILGHANSLDAILAEHRIDEVILAEPGLERENIPALLIACERSMAVFRIVPEVNDLLMSGMVVETLDGIPLLGIRETPIQGWNAALKRLVDFTAALLGLIFLAPVIAFFAWRIWRQDKHHPFFSQERMGIDGRLFRIIKLRTMPPNAEVQTGPTFADDRDSRCTPLGSALRHFHLDELPQLLNVLRGEMSLVGPRPERPYFIEQFREDLPRYMARHKVKSGITGWAQINGLCGRHGSIAERLKYDLYYIENWSLWLDVKIIALTIIGQQRPGPAR